MLQTRISLLQDTAVFEGLSEADLETVAQRLVELEFEDGDLLFREGAPGRYICFLTHGHLAVSKRTDDDREVEIATIEPGRSVGEMSIIDGLTCSATVTARGPASVLALTREHFDRLVEETPRLGAEIYKGISRLLSVSLRRTSEELARRIADV